ncbi:hypothetical protein [Rhizobium leguminosarum]|uniref:hypothetical protein n=1 Tax=Rhizobium leguminosarum TaxID=384 RepID=UPI0021BC2D4E|nr:hypothetical protein [Rhizobium leguminosarum]
MSRTDIQYTRQRQIVALVIGAGHPTIESGERLVYQRSVSLDGGEIDFPAWIIRTVKPRQVFFRERRCRRHMTARHAPLDRIYTGAAVSIVGYALDKCLHIRTGAIHCI